MTHSLLLCPQEAKLERQIQAGMQRKPAAELATHMGLPLLPAVRP